MMNTIAIDEFLEVKKNIPDIKGLELNIDV